LYILTLNHFISIFTRKMNEKRSPRSKGAVPSRRS